MLCRQVQRPSRLPAGRGGEGQGAGGGGAGRGLRPGILRPLPEDYLGLIREAPVIHTSKGWHIYFLIIKQNNNRYIIKIKINLPLIEIFYCIFFLKQN